jgi:hypothetical protein
MSEYTHVVFIIGIQKVRVSLSAVGRTTSMGFYPFASSEQAILFAESQRILHPDWDVKIAPLTDPDDLIGGPRY